MLRVTTPNDKPQRHKEQEPPHGRPTACRGETKNQPKNNTMNKTAQQHIEAVADGLNIAVTIDHNDNAVTFSFYSDRGQDFSCEITYPRAEGLQRMGRKAGEIATEQVDRIAEQLRDYTDDFDPVAEAMFWVDERGRGKNGAPGDIRHIIADFEQIEEKLRELAGAIEDEWDAFVYYND